MSPPRLRVPPCVSRAPASPERCSARFPPRCAQRWCSGSGSVGVTGVWPCGSLAGSHGVFHVTVPCHLDSGCTGSNETLRLGEEGVGAQGPGQTPHRRCRRPRMTTLQEPCCWCHPQAAVTQSGTDLASPEWPGGMHGRPSPPQWGRGRHGQGCRFVLPRPGGQCGDRVGTPWPSPSIEAGAEAVTAHMVASCTGGSPRPRKEHPAVHWVCSTPL